MKLPTAPPSGTALTGLLQWLRLLASAVTTGWGVEHRADGTHDWHWTAIPYSANTYFASGAMTWTVDPDQQQFLDYGVLGDLMCVRYRIVGSTIGGVASTNLAIRLPKGYVAVGENHGTSFHVDGGVSGVGVVVAPAGQRYLTIFNTTAGNWTVGAGTAVIGTILLRVAKD